MDARGTTEQGSGRRPRRPLRRGVSGVAARRHALLRRAGRPDRGHAPHPRRRETLDLREPVPACAELLHAAAGPGGAAARHLYRLADASHRRRPHGGRAVHPARHHRHHGAELHLRGLRQCRLRRGAVLRAEGRGARDRDPGAGAGRQARAAQQRHAGAGGDRLRRDLLLQRPLPDHHHRGRHHRLSRRQELAGREFAGGEHGGSGKAAAIDSMLGDAVPEHIKPNVGARDPRRRVLACAVAGAGRCDPDHARARPMCSARSRCSSARWRW